MATTSTFFNNFSHTETQNLLDSLVVESIRIHGQDCFYIPRRRDTFDSLLTEDDTSYFNIAYQIPMYVRTAEGFMNSEALFTQFGLEIRPQIVLSVSRKEFEDGINSLEGALIRPREGDLVYFPINRRLFEIKFVDDKPFFYQHGKLQMYDLSCELFEYSHELFTTGISEVDEVYQKLSINAYDYAIRTEDEKALLTEAGDILVYETYETNQDTYDPLADNDIIETESDRDNANTNLSVIDWSETNPFSDSNDGGKW